MKEDNPFKKLNKPFKEPPKHLKSNVMANVASAKLLMDIATLFTISHKSTINSLFKTKRKTK